MRNLKIIILAIFLTTIIITGMAKLSDETKELVNDLRWKHYGYGVTDNILTYDPHDFWQWTMTFDDGKLIIETSDGKWFVEMEKLK